MFIILWMAFGLMFILIGIGILWWKKNESLSKKEVFKNFSWKIASYVLVFGVIYSYLNYIPLNKNHGVEFNNEREKIGIPKIGKNWQNKKHQSDKFTTYWHNVESENGHFEKIIEYGILNIESETDYYKNLNRKESIAWSKYNFKNKTFEYFIKKLKNKNVSIRDSKKQKPEKFSIIEKINKSEFEKYITK